MDEVNDLVVNFRDIEPTCTNRFKSFGAFLLHQSPGTFVRVAAAIAVVGLVGAVSSWRLTTVEVVLLPKGFAGPVLLVWQHLRGEPIKKEGWRGVHYTVDSRGIAKFAEPRPLAPGLTFVRFYYVNPDGARQELSVNRGDFSGRSETPVIFSRSVGGATMRDGTELSWEYFCVGNPHPGNNCEALKSASIDKLLAQVEASERPYEADS